MMATGLQLAILSGCLVGGGVALLIARLVPTSVDARWAMNQLEQARLVAESTSGSAPSAGFQNRLGALIQRRVTTTGGWATVSAEDLRVLNRPIHEHLGEKGLLALIGLMFPTLCTLMVTLAGISLPVVFPAVSALVLAVLFWKAPDQRVRSDAKKARDEFVRGLATYVDLVALERASGTGTTQSLEAAARVGDSWVFVRIQECLAHARWAGEPPWDGLHSLGEELGIGELVDLAEIMRLSREEGATVYNQLKARAASIRNAQLSEDLGRANTASEQMSVPVSLLALVFLALLGAPAILRIASGV